ncbi:hypothetical protein D1007_53557 [Hordeum vulgare]|nr:hypothetical protein D1007_53557 [Hordeum vulgare]
MEEAIALSAADDCIVPPLPPPSLTRLEPTPTALKPHEYKWEGEVHEWVSMPPVWMGRLQSWRRSTWSTGDRISCGWSVKRVEAVDDVANA